MSASDTRVLVTGATGFLGRHVALALIEGGYEVVALCRNPDSHLAQKLPKQARRVQGDILDADSLAPALEGCAVVLHCAGKVSRDPDDAIAMHEANVTGTALLLDAAKAAGVGRFIHASTSGTIGISTDPDYIATENDPAPTELINKFPYYRTKLYAEIDALARNEEGFEVLSVNPSLLLGPGDEHGSSTEDVRRALEQPMPIATAGGVSFVDARDAAEAMVLAIEKGRPGSRYLLTACNCSVRTFFSRVARVAGTQGPMLSLPDDDRVRKASKWLVRSARKWLGEDDAFMDEHTVDVGQHYWYVDASLAEDELGWRPRDAMATLADTVADLRERGVVMMAAPK